MSKVVELIRVSTEAQAGDDRASIPAQRTVNRRTALAFGLEIVRTIEIVDVSGASIMAAPEMQELMRLVEDPAIQGVVARDFSRLSRERMSVTARILEHFEDNGVTLYTLDGAMNPADFAGMLMGTFRGLMSHKERTDFLAKVFASKEEKRRRGELAQNKVVLPWGVGYEPGSGFFYEPKAERVREAFRLFLSGEHSYVRLAKMIGVTPRGMHIIMRNPIWMGWRVIATKRDPSAAGRYASPNGRQADRRKIARAPDEVIRVHVIKEPLVSPADWQRAQQIMDLKQQRHWRSRPNYEHRFTYAGFLVCAACGSPIHSSFQRRDYYVCRARRTEHRCRAPYMTRERLEAELDRLFTRQLTDGDFLRECVCALQRRANNGEVARRREHLKAEIAKLQQRRTRILDTYLEGVLGREDRDRRLGTVDQELQALEQALFAAEAEAPAQMTVSALVELLAPLAEWNLWSYGQRRRVLAALVPEVRVADYRVESVGLRLDVGEDTRMDTGSSPPPA